VRVQRALVQLRVGLSCVGLKTPARWFVLHSLSPATGSMLQTSSKNTRKMTARGSMRLVESPSFGGRGVHPIPDDECHF
jgi:hypothetical protein